METLENELQKMYDSEIHVDLGWIWDGGIDVAIGQADEITGHVSKIAEVLPWLQAQIAKYYPASRYHVERMGGEWTPVQVASRKHPQRERTALEADLRTPKLSIVYRRHS
jgi:hypothetical protein